MLAQTTVSALLKKSARGRMLMPRKLMLNMLVGHQTQAAAASGMVQMPTKGSMLRVVSGMMLELVPSRPIGHLV